MNTLWGKFLVFLLFFYRQHEKGVGFSLEMAILAGKYFLLEFNSMSQRIFPIAVNSSFLPVTLIISIM